jgi:hypothetical protein
MASRDVLVDGRTVLITMQSISTDVQGEAVWLPFEPPVTAPWYVSSSRSAESAQAVPIALQAMADMLAEEDATQSG